MYLLTKATNMQVTKYEKKRYIIMYDYTMLYYK